MNERDLHKQLSSSIVDNVEEDMSSPLFPPPSSYSFLAGTDGGGGKQREGIRDGHDEGQKNSREQRTSGSAQPLETRKRHTRSRSMSSNDTPLSGSGPWQAALGERVEDSMVMGSGKGKRMGTGDGERQNDGKERELSLMKVANTKSADWTSTATNAALYGTASTSPTSSFLTTPLSDYVEMEEEEYSFQGNSFLLCCNIMQNHYTCRYLEKRERDENR